MPRNSKKKDNNSNGDGGQEQQQGMPDQMAMMQAMWSNPMMRMQMMQQMPFMGMMGAPMGMMGPMMGDGTGNAGVPPQHQSGDGNQANYPGFNPMAAMMMQNMPFMGMNPMFSPEMMMPNPNRMYNRGVPTEIEMARGVAEKVANKKSLKKKMKGKPKRPLSAYNLFFKDERERILNAIPEKEGKSEEDDQEGKSEEVGKEGKTPEDEREDAKDPQAKESDHHKDPKTGKKVPHGKIGFESLAKLIGKRWQELDSSEVEKYKALADEDAKRYKAEMEVFLTKEANGEDSGKRAGDPFSGAGGKKPRFGN